MGGIIDREGVAYDRGMTKLRLRGGDDCDGLDLREWWTEGTGRLVSDLDLIARATASRVVTAEITNDR